LYTRNLQQGYYCGNTAVIRGRNGEHFCEITAVIMGMGTALTGTLW